MATFKDYLGTNPPAVDNLLALYKGYVQWRLAKGNEVVLVQDLLNELAIMHQYCVNKSLEKETINFDLDSIYTIDQHMRDMQAAAAKPYNALAKKGMVLALASLSAVLFTAAQYATDGGIVALYAFGALVTLAAVARICFKVKWNEPWYKPAKDNAKRATVALIETTSLSTPLVKQVHAGQAAQSGLKECVEATTQALLLHRYRDGNPHAEEPSLSLKTLNDLVGSKFIDLTKNRPLLVKA